RRGGGREVVVQGGRDSSPCRHPGRTTKRWNQVGPRRVLSPGSQHFRCAPHFQGLELGILTHRSWNRASRRPCDREGRIQQNLRFKPLHHCTSLGHATRSFQVPASSARNKADSGGGMIKISVELAPVLVAAIRDATKYNSALARSETVKDPSDIEEFLVHLGNLEMEVRRQYEALERQNKDMLRSQRLWEPPPP